MKSVLQTPSIGRWVALLLLGTTITIFAASTGLAEEAAEAAPTQEERIAALEGSNLAVNADVLWTCLAAFMVFFMQAGFALVECGFTRAKNACNIIMKNVMDVSVGAIAFWVVGFGLMFGASYQGIIGTTGFLYDAGDDSFSWAFLLFQTVFAATAATIVSGAMAERTKYVAYLAYSVAITVIVYPIFGSWAWNGLIADGGWLEGGAFLESICGEGAAFYDFAGSTVVHSIGGWCALAGAIVIGPRIGKFGKNGKINPIPGHNIPFAALGVFILWLGWFGFNAGSTTALDSNFAYICITTLIAASAGAIGAMFASWIKFKKPDPSFTLNGVLAGLVGITAGCDAMSVPFAALTGLVAGIIVVLSVVAIDSLRIDDPVGAVSVHGVCGVWGTLAIGLFHTEAGLLVGGGTTQILAQLVGICAAFAWAFPVSLVIFMVIKATIGLRVSEAEEMEGLDICEHGMHAYPPHLISDSFSGSTIDRPAAMAGVAAPLPVAKPATDGA